ncbi:hypothetical protein AERO_04655 [Aeromicrobium fastidiosum]|uniref:hypothetical protein n=1 Tax=Aeromicrobium fastidiosum TaxID=52699 RepID=UPI0020232A6C|nr:hypothetical protein [Aeromicrobium fastidiosum]MCL8250666.1 hypothetical protein [Aeromicrobium fastidiosum]
MSATVIYEFENRASAEAVAAAVILLPEVVRMSLSRDPAVVSVDIDLDDPSGFDRVTRTIDAVAPSARRSFAQRSADVLNRAITHHEDDV